MNNPIFSVIISWILSVLQQVLFLVLQFNKTIVPAEGVFFHSIAVFTHSSKLCRYSFSQHFRGEYIPIFLWLLYSQVTFLDLLPTELVSLLLIIYFKSKLNIYCSSYILCLTTLPPVLHMTRNPFQLRLTNFILCFHLDTQKTHFTNHGALEKLNFQIIL